MLPNKNPGALAGEGAPSAEPDLRHLMASIIRLMANAAVAQCPIEQQTLQRLLSYLLKHPGMADAPSACAAIRHAAMVCAATQAPMGGAGREGRH